MLARKELRQEFIIENQLSSYQVIALKHDASRRRYFRLSLGNKNFILMDSPPDTEPVESFIKVTNYLRENGFSAPEILIADLENGFLLLEDFGNHSFNNLLLEDKSLEDEIYYAAIDVLIKLQKCKVNITLPKHDKSLLLSGLELFDKYCSDKNNNDLWQELLSKLNYNHSVIALRDYHADNLMWLDKREGIKKVGLLDYQDASLSFGAYDLVSLLQDARRKMLLGKQEKYLDYFIQKSEIEDQQKFIEEYNILSLQRNLRILGLFTKFSKIDGNDNYLKFMPNVIFYLEGNIENYKIFKNLSKNIIF